MREFLQKNFKQLPLDVFDEVEDIINEGQGGRKGAKRPRKMADTYKRVREIQEKYGKGEEEMDALLKKYLPPGCSKATVMSASIRE